MRIENIGVEMLRSGAVALRNTAHNIANENTDDAKSLETINRADSPYGVRSYTVVNNEHPTLINDMPNLLLNTTYTKMGTKIVKTADEIMGYILDMKA